jgi:hypothetical protein
MLIREIFCQSIYNVENWLLYHWLFMGCELQSHCGENISTFIYLVKLLLFLFFFFWWKSVEFFELSVIPVFAPYFGVNTDLFLVCWRVYFCVDSNFVTDLFLFNESPSMPLVYCFTTHFSILCNVSGFFFYLVEQAKFAN